jgi:uncharacterized membrane protein YgdD (TMEM256/DUF423 family)
MMYKQALVAGGLLAAIAVLLGAMGAHSLKKVLDPQMLAVFETGVRYHFYHSVGLLLAGIIYMQYPVKQLRLATTFFITGILLFSGSLYAIALLSISGISIGPAGILTPVGGVFFILGWLWMVIGITRGK